MFNSLQKILEINPEKRLSARETLKTEYLKFTRLIAPDVSVFDLDHK